MVESAARARRAGGYRENRRLREAPPPPKPEPFSAGRALKRAGILAPKLGRELADDAARGAQAVAERQPFNLGAAGGMLVAFAAGLAGLIFLDLLLSERGSRAGAGALGAAARGIRAFADPRHPLFVATPASPDALPRTAGPTSSTAPSRPPATSAAGGSRFRPTSGEWQGSKSVVSAFASIATGQGLRISSEKRPTRDTASGGRSDHWQGSTDSYAYDLSGSVDEMDAAARALMAALGIRWDGGELVRDVTRFGYRLQILYRTHVGGNHFDHIHIGVRRVG